MPEVHKFINPITINIGIESLIKNIHEQSQQNAQQRDGKFCNDGPQNVWFVCLLLVCLFFVGGGG